MSNNSKSTLMWENNPDTPLNAQNLSETLDFQSQSKFIEYTDLLSDYESWADYTINYTWPDPLTVGTEYLNKLTYNYQDASVRRLIYNSDLNVNEWEEDLPTPFHKILKIKAKTKISMDYIDVVLQKSRTLNFDFGDEDQIFSIDDLIFQDGETQDFVANENYFLYIFTRYSDNDSAYIKILKASEEELEYWKSDYPVENSPTGDNIIAYRKLGGFKTSATAEIDVSSLWDLSTYHKEMIADKIKVLDGDEVRALSASDFNVMDSQNLFSGQELTVEEALFQTKALINNLNNKFYTNRKIGVNVQFTHVKSDINGYKLNELNDVSIKITPGIIDVLETQITIDDAIFLADPDVGFIINDGASLVYNARLISEDDGSGEVLYPGVWSIFIDFNGQFHIKHEIEEGGRARWKSNYFGWFDSSTKRSIGKFRVVADGGNYIQKFSVTDTFDINAATNSIHIHYGTLCPDGLLPCDGKWHDVNGIDPSTYLFEELPLAANWGDSWYEETPNYIGRTIKGMTSFDGVGGPYNPLTNAGGADDYTTLGGSNAHTHEHPHSHDPGVLNILESGAHPGAHDVDFNSGVEYVNVNTTTEGGVHVAIENHEHNITITGGNHSHQDDSFSGNTDSLSGSAATTDAESSWAPYREAMICIKKV